MEIEDNGAEVELDAESEPELDQSVVSDLTGKTITMKEEEDSFPSVCGLCKEKNLTEEVYHATCRCCGIVYCIHFASSVDSQFCSGCNSDVQMTEQTITKTTEHYNEEKDKVYSKTSKARQISFTGMDWLFYQRKIKIMSDTELLLMIEYHQAMMHALAYERDIRRAEYLHRNAGKQVIIRKSDGESITKVETKVKKTRTISADKKDKAAVLLMAMMQTMLDAGKSPAEIMAALGGK